MIRLAITDDATSYARDKAVDIKVAAYA